METVEKVNMSAVRTARRNAIDEIVKIRKYHGFFQWQDDDIRNWDFGVSTLAHEGIDGLEREIKNAQKESSHAQLNLGTSSQCAVASKISILEKILSVAKTK